MGNRHELRAGHDLNYLGWAGALAATAPATPPVPVADYAGAYAAVREALAGLLERARTGEGSRSGRLADPRVGRGCRCRRS